MSRLDDLLELSDRELLSAHCAGDADAFGEIFRRHRDRMWAVALRTTRDPEMAADAVQEAFIAAFRRADSFRGDAAVTTWLHRIVVNSCLDRLRRTKPVVGLPDADHSDLADRHGLSITEAASILDGAEGTSKSRCARGRAAMVPSATSRMLAASVMLSPCMSTSTNAIRWPSGSCSSARWTSRRTSTL